MHASSYFTMTAKSAASGYFVNIDNKMHLLINISWQNEDQLQVMKELEMNVNVKEEAQGPHHSPEQHLP